MIGDVIVSTTTILLCTGLAAQIVRRQSAAVRHAVWSAGILAVLVLPFLEIVVPSWQVSAPTTRAGVDAGWQAMLAVPSVAPALMPLSKAAAEPNAQSAVANWLVVGIGVVWALGALLLLLKFAVHLKHIASITRRAQPAPAHLTRRFAALSRVLRVRRNARLLMSNEVVLPASWGIRQPVVLLPSGAVGWPADRVRAALLHETAHITRFDWAYHLLTELARALHWINPLMWIALRRADVLRERACDDVALCAGMARTSYAAVLVDLARSSLPGLHRVASLSMARRSGLAERVKGILDGSADRAPAGVTRVGIIGAVAAAVAIPVAAIQVVDRPPSVQVLMDRLNSEDVLVARRAAWGLGEREDLSAVPALIGQLRAGDADVRLVTAWALGEIKDPRAVGALSNALDDPDPFVREMVTLALGEIEHPSAIESIRRAFDSDEALRAPALWAMGEIETDRAVRVRRTMAQRLQVADGPHEEVWVGRVDDGRGNGTVTTWLGQLNAPEATVRRAAAQALGRADEERAVDALLDTLRDPDPTVRAMAVWALDEINPSHRN